jgi:5-methylcytosine-specific restriction protein A
MGEYTQALIIPARQLQRLIEDLPSKGYGDIKLHIAHSVDGYKFREVPEVDLSRFYDNYSQLNPERNPKLRAAAILIHGTECMVCGFDFEKVYGECGAGFIEVHHMLPVSSLKEEILVDPITDAPKT